MRTKHRNDTLTRPTSAWPPGFSVLLQRSHFRQNLCQSFPKDDTFSAAKEEEEEMDGISASHVKTKATYAHVSNDEELRYDNIKK